ncbi:MAG TPA: hypothetical protein VFB62_23590 [Polyangiaceae bacterium]|nr:hypothetical protein [Polyangiaceae bacterium]
MRRAAILVIGLASCGLGREGLFSGDVTTGAGAARDFGGAAGSTTAPTTTNASTSVGAQGGANGAGGMGGAGNEPCGMQPVPPGGTCPDVCNGGCNGPNNTNCVIVCGSTGCIGDTIVCPPGFSCELQCDGSEACDEATLDCPAEYSCKVTCANATESCEALVINCGTSASCTVDCGQGSSACLLTELQCGKGACGAKCSGGGQDLPQVSCNNSCSCTSC